ncbi:hypothetical protein ACIP79_01575 [Streptomyces sp. NPDC088747]|uniref:hypothetical protein n=1 Tax=Streptomyces sp. NPDC088747 TaxID=3365886 RepID=UPI0037F473D6
MTRRRTRRSRGRGAEGLFSGLLLFFCTGALFWGLVLGDPRQSLAAPRSVAVLIAGVVSGLIGLALVLGDTPVSLMARARGRSPSARSPTSD